MNRMLGEKNRTKNAEGACEGESESATGGHGDNALVLPIIDQGYQFSAAEAVYNA